MARVQYYKEAYSHGLASDPITTVIVFSAYLRMLDRTASSGKKPPPPPPSFFPNTIHSSFFSQTLNPKPHSGCRCQCGSEEEAQSQAAGLV